MPKGKVLQRISVGSGAKSRLQEIDQLMLDSVVLFMSDPNTGGFTELKYFKEFCRLTDEGMKKIQEVVEKSKVEHEFIISGGRFGHASVISGKHADLQGPKFSTPFTPQYPKLFIFYNSGRMYIISSKLDLYTLIRL